MEASHSKVHLKKPKPEPQTKTQEKKNVDQLKIQFKNYQQQILKKL